MTITPEMQASVPFQYAYGVLEGRIVTGRRIRQAVDRFFRWIERAEADGFVLDHRAGMMAVNFFPFFLHHTKGDLAKQQKAFDLTPHQQFFVYNIIAWKTLDGRRRIRKAFLKEARKNGKTAFASGLGLYLQAFDDEPGAEIYCGATKEAQAKVVWEQAEQFVYKSLKLRSIGFSKTNREIRFQRTKVRDFVTCVFRYLGGDSETLDGLNPSVAIIDEYHAHKDDGVLEVLESAMGARTSPLTIIITTAGFNIMSPCKHFEDTCAAVLSGEKEDISSLFIMMHDLDEGDNWEDESTWIKANPNLHYNPPLLSIIRGEYEMAKVHPSKIPNFKTKHLNMWVDAPEIWIPTEIWRQGIVDEMPLNKFLKHGAYAGLDLSTTTDLTAFVVLSEPDESGDRYLVPFLFCPADTIDRRSKEDRVPYRAWADAGHIIATPGNQVDYTEVENIVVQSMAKYKVKRVEIDRHNATGITQNLQAAGLEVGEFSQTISNYNEPTKEFSRLVYLGKIKHTGNPVMEWMLNGCVAIQDSNENVRLHKGKSHAHGKRIDGIIASIMALGGSMTGPGESNESIYNDPNVKFVC